MGRADALGAITTYGYDALGRSVRVQDARGSLSSRVYDARGLPVTSVEPRGWMTSSVYDAAGRPVALVNANGYRTTSVYDAAGRNIATVDALGYVSSSVYDAVGQQIASVDALGRRVSSVYDRWGKVLSEQDARGFVTSFVYDALDRQVAVVDAVGNRTSSVYDGRGLLASTRSAWGALTSSSYDGVGNVVSRVDGRGLRTSYLYDALDRPSVMVKPEGSRASFAYDAAGQLVKVAESAGVTSMSYDAVGRVLSVALPSGASLSYGYDSIGNRLWMADDKSARTTYSYAPLAGTTIDYLVVTPPYEPNGPQSRVAFDRLNRVDVKYLGSGQSSLSSLESQRFTPNGWKLYHRYADINGVEQGMYYPNYDKVGNRIVMQERTQGGVYTNTYFGYDASNQLINERRVDTPGYNVTYTYDGTGNRLVQNDGGALTTYSYGSGNRLMQEVTGSAVTSYSYDANGNQTLINAGGQITTYAWDGENRLKQVVQPDGTSEKHEYDVNGLRRRKSVTSPSSVVTTRVYVWDGQSLVQERNESNLLLAQYTWAPESWDGFWSGGELMDVLFLERRASTPGDMVNAVSRYHGEDPSYNTRLLIDPAGNVSDRFSFKSFGELWNHLGSGMTPFLFGGAVGYYFDAVKRTYVQQRVLDPKSGRWISPDPIGFDGGDWNLYGYVENMPVNDVDPEGLKTKRLPPIIVGGGGPIGAGFTPIGGGVRSPYGPKHQSWYRAQVYCAAAAARNYESRGLNCFCNVATQLVPIIQGDMLGPHSMRQRLNCINQCLFQFWKQRSTPAWYQASQACCKHGQGSDECCRANIRAEQKALTRCEKFRCRGVGAWGPAGYPFITGGFPITANEVDRIPWAQNTCCSKGGEGDKSKIVPRS